MWPLFPPLLLLQYIKQTDAEMLSIEKLRAAAERAPGAADTVAAAAAAAPAAAAAAAAPRWTLPVRSFLDLRKTGWTGHWRFQQDLAVIRQRTNKN
ncbi:hypothetical protein, conserved [Eimeria tenella]|uniref:Uncharacterized protein n=1 Tax=Eimeria tenella TaxID=5802 RepID=U6KLY4_EIMTE|nr:hypothetical protein, conserved [Eimeria tenella]CDJ39117.1 hypothetical protein, conserved [Eimeria tenella]|eukprot:XP_013229872.1 hypothetical protein, conserved [Eimeria tenella]